MNSRTLLTSCMICLLSYLVSAQSFSPNTRNLSLDEITLLLDGEPFEGREFPLRSQARLVFEGIQGYQLQSELAFPQLSLRVTEKGPGGKVVLEWDNLLEEYADQGVSVEKASVLSASLTIGDPLQLGQTYQWEVIITEGTGKGRIELSYEFKVTEPRPIMEDEDDRFLFETTELSLQEVALEVDDEPWPSLDLPNQKQVDMIFKGIQGFGLRDGLVHPGLAVRVTDTEGRVVLSAADLFADADGFPPEEAERLISNLTIGNPMQLGQSYLWEVYIWDKTWPRRSAYAWLKFKVISR